MFLFEFFVTVVVIRSACREAGAKRKTLKICAGLGREECREKGKYAVFLVLDTLEERQEKIASFDEPFIAVLLAAPDFEWTARRAILALGSSTTKEIKENTLKLCSGLKEYKDAWKEEVQPLTGKGLPEIIPGWQYFRESAYPLRNRLVHGIEGSVTSQYAQERVEAILSASKAVTEFADSFGEPLYGRRIVRRKPRKELRGSSSAKKKQESLS